MNIKHKSIIGILTSLFDISEGSLIAFRGRIQHMQRLGFPPGSNTGKGRPSNYGWRELFLLSLAFQYLEMGATPDRAVNELAKYEDLLLASIKSVILDIYGTDQVREPENFLVLEVSALQSLKEDQSSRSELSVMSQSKIRTLFDAECGPTIRPRYNFIDLAYVLSTLIDKASDQLGLSDNEIVRSLLAWASPIAEPEVQKRRA